MLVSIVSPIFPAASSTLMWGSPLGWTWSTKMKLIVFQNLPIYFDFFPQKFAVFFKATKQS